ncbi:hypothetical protein [Sphingosinicella sp. BN140058]|uniref:hypothetical protein n=1 Tax=Sphingosinicella sp. BN140058 TaxID=1892855 RepID=UPI001012466D|nr:hypothetical protein [Sphingosinicella sp. BN140058]QAY78398.1 hypothetical protein ETR14_19045 [Sphingosinicella sp. BN140058]
MVWIAFVGAVYLAGTYALFRLGIIQTYGISERLDTGYALLIVNQSCPILAATAGLLLIGVLDRWLTVLLGKGGLVAHPVAGPAAVCVAAAILALLFTGATMASFWAADGGAGARSTWRGGTDVWTGFVTDLFLVFVFLQFLHALTRRWPMTAFLFVLYAAAVIAAGPYVDARLFGFGSTPNLMLTFATRHAVGLEAAWLFRGYWALAAVAMVCLLAGLDDRTTSMLRGLRHAERRGRARLFALVPALGAVIAMCWVAADLRNATAVVERTYAERDLGRSGLIEEPDRRPTAVAAKVAIDARQAGAGIRVDGVMLVRNDGASPLHSLLFEKAPVLRIVSAHLADPGQGRVESDARRIAVRMTRPLRPGATALLRYRGLLAPVNRLDVLARSVVMPDAFVLTTAMFLPLPRKASCMTDQPTGCAGENYQLSDRLYGTISVRAPAGLQIASAGLGGGAFRGSQWQAAIPPAALSNLLIAAGRFRIARLTDPGTGLIRTAYAAPYSLVSPGCVARYASDEIGAYSRLWRPLPPTAFDIIETPNHLNQTSAFYGAAAISERYLRPSADCLTVGTRLVLSHEIAHQWWGYSLVPEKKPGAPLVLESFAQAAALARLEQRRILSTSQISALLKDLTAPLLQDRGAAPPLSGLVQTDERAYYEGPMVLLGAAGNSRQMLDAFGIVLRDEARQAAPASDPAQVIDHIIRSAPPAARPAIRAGLQ